MYEEVKKQVEDIKYEIILLKRAAIDYSNKVAYLEGALKEIYAYYAKKGGKYVKRRGKHKLPRQTNGNTLRKI